MQVIISNKETIELEQLYDFIVKVDHEFPIPLSDKVNLKDYSLKLYNNGDFYAAISNNNIVGIIAGYNNDYQSKESYISLLALLKEYRGYGISKQLILTFIEASINKKMEKISAYTHQTNTIPINLYTKMGFINTELNSRGYLFVKYLT